jgi:hypothetical protein
MMTIAQFTNGIRRIRAQIDEMTLQYCRIRTA